MYTHLLNVSRSLNSNTIALHGEKNKRDINTNLHQNQRHNIHRHLQITKKINKCTHPPKKNKKEFRRHSHVCYYLKRATYLIKYDL